MKKTFVRKIFLTFTIIAFSLATFNRLPAQEKTLKLSPGMRLCTEIASRYKIPQPAALIQNQTDWKKGTLLQLGFTQTSFSNWASGGNSSVALNANVNYYVNYTHNDILFENRLQVAYGFIQAVDDRYKKSDDKFIIDSKFGYEAWDRLYASAIFNFKTQMTNGFDYPAGKPSKLNSAPFSPAYLSLGVGLDYKPNKSLSLVLSPLTGNLVLVGRESLRKKFGNAIDEPARLKLGAQLKAEYKKKIIENINLETSATFFSDFLGNPENIKVNWDLFVDAKINKYFSTSLRTNLIYDDDVLIANNAGVLAPRVQFKEILQVGFSYTIGAFKK